MKPTEIKTTNKEYENEKVPDKALKKWTHFLGMYAGEHAAGTEFIIGPLFLTTGVSAFDLLAGLLIGNLLAVLSWRFLTAEIAVKYRFTLYHHLEKITGAKLVKLYNIANGVLFCFLAGAMITVSATAVGIPFNMEMPQLKDTLPNGIIWVLVVLILGLLFSLIAANGFATVSKAANYMAPFIILAFVICGFVALNQLDVGSFSDFWAIWGKGSTPFPGQIKYTFWHVCFWSWFANAAMHIGMSDLSVFRYAETPSAGWTTAVGMYIGHYMAWIAAALLYAVYIQSPEAQAFLAKGTAPSVAPGPLAYNAIGVFGILAVVLAGWTTANPTIYRAGLAFQTLFPKRSTFWVTMVAGGVATTAGLFPAFAMKLLDFVALYGFILSPVGAIIVFQHFFGKRFNIPDYLEFPLDKGFNWNVLWAWTLSIVVFYGISVQLDLFLSFLTLPTWISCGLIYLLFSKLLNKLSS